MVYPLANVYIANWKITIFTRNNFVDGVRGIWAFAPVMKIGLLATLAEMCRMGLPMEDYTCAICKLYINAVCKQPNRNTGQAASFPVCAKQRAWNAGSMTSRGVHRLDFLSRPRQRTSMPLPLRPSSMPHTLSKDMSSLS